MEEKKSSRDFLQAQAHLWRHTFSFINSMCLKCAVELGIFDAIYGHGRPITITELCAALSVPVAKLRYLRGVVDLLVHCGFLARHEQGDEEEDSFSLTVNSVILVREKKDCLSAFVDVMLDPMMLLRTWSHVASWLKDGDEEVGSPFEFAHGRSVMEVACDNSQFMRLFNEAMEGDTLLTCGFVKEHGVEIFGSLHSLIDVGGGTGTLARAIAEAFPHVKCTVLDLPPVVESAKSQGYAGVEYIAGDMFEPIPHADAVLLKWILHMWSDDECVRVLQRCREAIPSRAEGGKVIVIDMVKGVKYCDDDGDGGRERAQTEIIFDLHMMTQTRGKERNEDEWKKIIMAAGFKEYKVMPILGMRALMELYH